MGYSYNKKRKEKKVLEAENTNENSKITENNKGVENELNKQTDETKEKEKVKDAVPQNDNSMKKKIPTHVSVNIEEKIDYSKFDLKKNYYLICPNCHKYAPKEVTIKYDQEKNDFIIIYTCQCNFRDSTNNLIEFIDTKKPSNYDTIEMKQFLDALMEKGKTTKDEFKGFELIKSINKTFLRESNFFSAPQLFYKCVKTFKECEDKIFSLIKLKNNLILAGTEKGKIFIINFEFEYKIKEIQVKGKVLCFLEFEENNILAGTSDNNIVLWNINDQNYKYIFIGHSGWVNSLTKCNDEIFASASNDKTIRIWNYKEKQIINTINTDSSVLSLIKLKDGKLCSSENDSLIKIWDWENGECIYNLIGHENRVRSICQLKDGTFVSGDDDYKIIIWKNKEIFKILEGHKKEIRTLCQIDDNHFASGSIDNTIKIWNYKNSKCIQTLENKDGGHSSNVTNIIKLKNNMFASSSSDKTIKLWKNNFNN
jgi:WD40 repeat protein